MTGKAKQSSKKGDVRSALRALALAQPGTSEGVACAGTPLEKSTIKVRDKAFVFIGQKDVMLKLAESMDEARSMAESNPPAVKVGARGWVTAQLDALPRAVLERWIEESYRAIGSPKRASRVSDRAPRREG